VIWDAVVLAGGRARRLEGVDKAALVLDGRTLLDRALAATADARTRIVVGPTRPAPPDVRFVLESPRYGGPVAALAAGLGALPSGASAVAVLAADQPNVEAALPCLLATDLDGADGVVAVDPDGRDQPLLAFVRTAALAEALATLTARRGDLDGAALRDVLPALAVIRLPLPAALCADVDTPADARAARIALPSDPPLPTPQETS
jgi:molybdopterin-guanine dinucleotide biosynthesis protein A